MFVLPWSRSAVLIVAAVVALVATACAGGTDDAWGSAVGGSGDQPAVTPVSAAAGSDPSFGDPGELAGFDGVEEEPALDLSPDALPDVDQPDVPGPDDVVPVVTDELAAVPLGEEILDTVDAIDEAPNAEERGDGRDGHRRNEAGALVVLDDLAQLACGDVEVAITRLDEGDRTSAGERVTSAADRADRSTLAEVRAWAPVLTDAATAVLGDGAVDPAPLIGFLSACADGGYEL